MTMKRSNQSRRHGKRVAAGPSTGTVDHWRYASLDVVPFLKPGGNLVSAIVWNGGKPAPPPLPAYATDQQRMKATIDCPPGLSGTFLNGAAGFLP